MSIADVVGYFDEDRSDERVEFVPFVPERVFDTRLKTAVYDGSPVGPGNSLVLLAEIGVSTFVFNVTATEPTEAGYVTVYPYPGSVPLASNLNFVAGQTVPNLVYAASDSDVGIFNSAGRTHIIVDLFGAFT